MYVHSIRLVNFKSIGDYPENEVIIDPRITAIIGKNESGKSNILDGVSRIGFTKRNPSAFPNDVINRNSPTGTPIKYKLTLKPSTEDIASGITEETDIEITQTQALVTGGFLKYYSETLHSDFLDFVNYLNNTGSNPFQIKDQELTLYRSCLEEMGNSSSLDLYQRTASLDFLHSKAGSFPSAQRAEYRTILADLRDKWFMIETRFPAFFYRKADKHLSATYKYEDVEKELAAPNANPNSLLFNFVKLIDIPTADFLSAVKSSTSARPESLRMKIQRKVDEKINRPFHNFYQTETISLHLSFNSNSVSFMVQSEDGEALKLSERSNGLRWYLEVFIDARANDISGRNVVYLFDEPGTSLHVNAQRELLQLFSHLADQGHQVLYTTHSPYMLNTEIEGVHRIRAVVKDSEGFSRIYKTAYDSRIAPESQQDTLAPIISAIGMNLNDTFGPAKDKVNIVTEGMSDYIYLCTMAKLLNVDTTKFAIIPSVGASNCVNICTILHGWGCKYIALFDYDKAGVETGGEFFRTKMFFEMNRQYCYLKDVSQDEIDNKSYRTSKYLIEDVVTQAEIDRFCEATNTAKTLNKTLIAKKMENAIEKEGYVCGEECINNFKALFARIFAYTT